MSALLEGLFLAVAASAFVGVPLYAWRQRGRPYAIFAAVILGFSLPGAVASELLISPRVPEPVRFWVVALFAYSVTAAGLHLAIWCGPACARPRIAGSCPFRARSSSTDSGSWFSSLCAACPCGLFAQGASYLYVHRGTGFYGFPLRVGVPGELSVLELSLV